MKRGELDEVGDLVELARDLYGDDPAASEELDAYSRRLQEPLRLAVAGVVKAGKSTLLNAMIGEQIAPTDAGECTRTVTWYRHSRTAQITVHRSDGGVERMPVRRDGSHLVLDIGNLTADEVEWIDVAWPAENLRSTVLIDTPGIASLSVETSAKSTRFLTPENTHSAADAIIYLLRHIHAADVKFLQAFRDTAAGASETVNAVAVLSRADEIGSGRIDSLLSAARIAERYRQDGELRALTLGVIPVAGLVAEGARTLRESEFIAFRSLAALDRTVRERLLVSVDRFTRPTNETALSVAVRQDLLRRFGIFGVRLGAALVRAGADSSSELADRLVQQSGLIDLQRFVNQQFRSRTVALKARGVLQGLDALLRAKPRPGTAPIVRGMEHVTASTHDLAELSLLADLRTSVLSLTPDDLVAAERLIGGNGTDALTRLGLAEGAPRVEVRERIDGLLGHWRNLSESPLSMRATTDLCRVVIRSIEGIASEATGPRRSSLSPGDVVLAGGPA
ncbi:MAG TPA: dynamin family protein [Microbacterium sp.]|uniref:dynamin family protein n=1 Tax=Microbacterium sp. TaxID=51671 RepID=UPI002C9D3E98|nr:dynamin family protein [Microbacterium sp.]HWI31681.1 dynamin family protein [Microbacterium sp.]